MAFIPTSPGVHVREIPSGARTIVDAPTSIAAFVGRFAQGPLNTPVRLFNLADFERAFGSVSSNHPTSLAVFQFFVNGGGEAYVVRVAATDALASDVTLPDANGDDTLRVYAVDPGEWGDAIRIDVDRRTADPETVFHLRISEVREHRGREVVVRAEEHRNLTIGGPRDAATTVNGASSIVGLEQVGSFPPMPTGTRFVSGDASQDLEGAFKEALEVDANDPIPGGKFPFHDDIQVDLGTGMEPVAVPFEAVPGTLSDLAVILQSAFRDQNAGDPVWAGAQVSAVEGGRILVLPGRSLAPTGPVTINDDESGEDVLGSLGFFDGSTSNQQRYSLTGGVDGTALTAVELRGSPSGRTGFYALDDVKAFNVLAIPEASALGGTTQLSSVMSPAATYCAKRRAMLIIDPPDGLNTLQDAENWLGEIADAGLRAPDAGNTVAYYPRVRIPDPNDASVLLSVAPSGTMAGIWARNDAQAGVWSAPAGIRASLKNVGALDHSITDDENGVINPLGLNALRDFDIPGNVCWGARTLAGADEFSSDWKYLQVRRMAYFVQTSLVNGLAWAVFRSNDEPLWREIRSACNAFMHGLFRQGSFQGRTPRDAYRVACSNETTSPADVAAGVCNVYVSFAPLRPAEYIVLSLQLQLSQDS